MRFSLRQYAERYEVPWPDDRSWSRWDWVILSRAWLVQCDYSQLENRIVALLSGDPLLLEWFDRGIDVHSQTAASLMGIPYEEYLTLRAGGDKRAEGYRQLSKTVRYGRNYLGAARTIWEQIVVKNRDVTLQQVEKACDTIDDLHKPVFDYHYRNMAQAHDIGYIEAPLSGRRLHFHGKVDLNLLANWPIQATGADVINGATRTWWREYQADRESGTGWRMMEDLKAQVHDSLVVSTPNPFGSLQQLQKHMGAPRELAGRSMSFPVDGELGMHLGPDNDNWGLRGVSMESEADRLEMLDWMVRSAVGAGCLTPAVW